MENKETLEEVAERIFNIPEDKIGDVYYGSNIAHLRKGFKFGAKWQQERSYSEEDMKFAYEQGARLALLSQTDLARHKGEFPNPEEWFNEFKKI